MIVEWDGTQQPIEEALIDGITMVKREGRSVAVVQLHPIELAYLVRHGLFTRPTDRAHLGVDWWTLFGWVSCYPMRDAQPIRLIDSSGVVVGHVKRINADAAWLP